MFTTCPECGTVFRIGPGELRRAAGKVRCGHCDSAFNALESLSETAPDSSAAPPVPAQQQVAPAPAGSAGEEAALEFDVPPDSWSSFFAGSELPGLQPGPPAPDAAEERQETPPPELADDAPTGEVPLDAEVGRENWDELLEDLYPGEEDPQPAPVYVIDAGASEAAEPPDRMPELRERLYPPPPQPAPLPEEELAIADLAASRPAARRRRRWPYLTGSLLLLLGLLAQWIHVERDRLAAHPAWGATLRAAYARFDQPLYPEWRLSAYSITGSEAIAGRAAPDALEIIARLQITGNDPTGLPLVRIVVRDRWANPVGQRLLAPADYAGTATGETVAPGTILPVQVALRDPGIEAHGYEVDICLHYRREGLVCQLDQPVFRR